MEANAAIPAGLIGDPVRAAILMALREERSLPVTALARAAGVSVQLAGNHLAELLAGGLLQVTPRGRHRYYRLAGTGMAHALVALPAPAMLERQYSAKARRLRAARTCYGHLAGQLGVALADAMAAAGIVTAADAERLMLTKAGYRCMAGIGLEPAALAPGRQGHARFCLDWTERRQHLAGPMPSRLFTRLLELGWLQRGAEPRAILVTPHGQLGLRQSFGVVLQTDPAAQLISAVNSRRRDRSSQSGAREPAPGQG